MTKSFDYALLNCFTEFDDLCNPDHYKSLSDDWWVIVTDIQGSTKAIQEGRYKDVNLIGAASIMAVLNAIDHADIPYVFGGDGATVCVPNDLIELVKPALRASRQMSQEQFGLGLRLGLVPVSVISQAGKSVRIAKFRASEHYCQAMFDGDGLAYAESLIKDPDNDQFRIAENDTTPSSGDFSGLECRWQNITSPKGEMHSLLIAARHENPEQRRHCYEKTLRVLRDIYDDQRDSSPVTQAHLKLSTDKKQLAGESRVRTFGRNGLGSWLYHKTLPLIVRVGRFLMRAGLGHWKTYRADLIANSDYRKYDEMLRMVLIGSAEQRKALCAILDQAYQDGDIYYGIHHSDSALMTCVIFSYHNNHVHFIDGSDGGYALAAKQLKAQMKND